MALWVAHTLVPGSSRTWTQRSVEVGRGRQGSAEQRSAKVGRVRQRSAEQRSAEAHTGRWFRGVFRAGSRAVFKAVCRAVVRVEFRVVIRAAISLPDAASKAPGSVVIRVVSRATHVPSSVLTALKNLNQRAFNMN